MDFQRARIRDLIEARGLSIRRFAQRLDVSPTAVCGWLEGMAQPQLGTLTRICKVFQVPITYFFEPANEGCPETKDPPATEAQPKTGRKRK